MNVKSMCVVFLIIFTFINTRFIFSYFCQTISIWLVPLSVFVQLLSSCTESKLSNFLHWLMKQSWWCCQRNPSI